MENKKPVAQPLNQEEEISILTKAKKNKNTIIGICVAIILIAAGAIIWILVDQSHARKANEAIAIADIEMFGPALFGGMPNDSLALDAYMKAADKGNKSGARAALQAGILLYQDGKYQEAIDYLKKGANKSSIFEAGRLTLMGDCYANLGQLDDALSSFKKAYSAADKNPQIAPFILVKEANIYRAQEKYEQEYLAYQTVINEYPVYTQSISANARVDLRKYMERAKAQAGK